MSAGKGGELHLARSCVPPTPAESEQRHAAQAEKHPCRRLGHPRGGYLHPVGIGEKRREAAAGRWRPRDTGIRRDGPRQERDNIANRQGGERPEDEQIVGADITDYHAGVLVRDRLDRTGVDRKGNGAKDTLLAAKRITHVLEDKKGFIAGRRSVDYIRHGPTKGEHKRRVISS